MDLPHDKYFEGILQLRDPTPELMEFVHHLVRKKTGVYITKEVKFKNGVDYYFSSQKYLQVVGKKLKESFPGEYKLSATLHTKDSQANKELYRITIFFRCHNLRKGQIVDYQGEEYKVVSIGEKITGKNMKTGRNVFLDLNQLR